MYSHLLPFVFVCKLCFLLLGQVPPHLPNDPTNLPKLQLWVFILHLERKRESRTLWKPHQPDPKLSCCTACRASRASLVLLEVLEPHEPEVFWLQLVEG